MVLAYHAVADIEREADPHRLVLHPRLLEDQLDMLTRRRYRFLTAAELWAETGGRRPPAGTAVLTFDDGWMDAVETVAPLLRRRGIKATFYVCPGWLGGQHPEVPGPAGRLLTTHAVKELRKAGMEVASHSMVHRDLTLLDPDELAADLATSKRGVEDLVEEPCRTFAYPYGLFGPREEAAVAEAGYDLALAWQPGPWRAHAVPRLPAPPRNGGRRLALKLLGVRKPDVLRRWDD